MTALEVFGWQGKVRRGVYALAGCIGLAIKHNLDRFIALSFGERWSLWSYWAPIGRLSGMQALSANDKKFLLTLFVTAIPFIWIGLTMTVKRLRDAGQPTWLATLFFAPVIEYGPLPDWKEVVGPGAGSLRHVRALGSYAAATSARVSTAPSFARVVRRPKRSISLPVHTLVTPSSGTTGAGGRRRQASAAGGASTRARAATADAVRALMSCQTVSGST